MWNMFKVNNKDTGTTLLETFSSFQALEISNSWCIDAGNIPHSSVLQAN